MILALDETVQRLRKELAEGRAAVSQQRTARTASSAVPFAVLGPDDAPPQLEESLYKRVHGFEPWEKDGLSVLQLHNIPNDDWIANATKVVSTCDLETQPAYETEEITLVTALLDLGRGKAESGSFIRPMQEYFNRFQRIINRGFKMVIYMPQEFEASLVLDPARVKVVHFTVDDLKTYFPYWDRLHAVRKSKLWQAQAEYIGCALRGLHAQLHKIFARWWPQLSPASLTLPCGTCFLVLHSCRVPCAVCCHPDVGRSVHFATPHRAAPWCRYLKTAPQNKLEGGRLLLVSCAVCLVL